jgi:predicted NAD-dependent protein-ADP-ribosyltransferase YbiA (DUF1768 family)
MGGPGKIDNEEHDETDNFLEVNFKINDIIYCSAENYFQCCKTTNKEQFEYIYKSGPGVTAWKAGADVTIRDDWEEVKVDVMYEGNKAKFEQNPELAKKLCSTKGQVIFTKSSDFWNYWNGRIMERIRAEIRQDGEFDLKIAAERKASMDDYRASKKK